MKKENLPSKICITCNRPFTWRKKWEKVWQEVKYCSARCRSEKNRDADKLRHEVGNSKQIK